MGVKTAARAATLLYKLIFEVRDVWKLADNVFTNGSFKLKVG